MWSQPIVCLALFGLCHYCVADVEVCYGSEVALRSSGSGVDVLTQWGFKAEFGAELAVKEAQALPLPLAVAEPADACEPLSVEADWQGTAILVLRGTCNYTDKARHVARAGGLAFIAFNNDTGCLPGMGGNDTEGVFKQLIAVSISSSGGQALLEAAAAGGRVSIWAPSLRAVDPSAAVIWLVAVGTAVASALWAGSDFRSELRAAGAQQGASARAKGEPVSEVLTVTGSSAIGFVLVSSTMLLVMYFFLNRAFFIVLVVLFCLAAFQAVAAAFAALICHVLPASLQRSFNLPWLGPVPGPALVAAVPSAALVATWAACQQSDWAWVLQDLMGMALMALILRQFRLPNVQGVNTQIWPTPSNKLSPAWNKDVASILLPVCFLYDIFWVFIQPLLTNGTSVMVEVATGGAAHERMPMLILVPRFWGPPGYSLLGFGDVVLPGLLLVYTRVWDLANAPHLGKGAASVWGGYFAWASVGYGAGLLCTYAALLLEIGGDQGQPALLYLIPCTLGLVLLLGWKRGELPAMWQGNVTENALSRLSKDSDADSQPDVESVAESIEGRTSRGQEEAASLLTRGQVSSHELQDH